MSIAELVIFFMLARTLSGNSISGLASIWTYQWGVGALYDVTKGRAYSRSRQRKSRLQFFLDGLKTQTLFETFIKERLWDL